MHSHELASCSSVRNIACCACRELVRAHSLFVVYMGKG
jgi:hypothetical protein